MRVISYDLYCIMLYMVVQNSCVVVIFVNHYVPIND